RRARRVRAHRSAGRRPARRGFGRRRRPTRALQCSAAPARSARGRRKQVSAFFASVLTLYPQMFPGPLGLSLAGRALDAGLWKLETVQIRDFATDRHRSVDDTPAGGGAGMVMRADVLARAIDQT